MKDQEMTRRLQEALNCLEAINLVPLRATDAVLITQVKDLVQPVLAALEANPPLEAPRVLAEVEVEARQRLSIQLDDKRADVHIFNVPVTVTIRGR